MGKTDIVYIGTILHYDSVLSRTLNNAMWRTVRFKAILQWPVNMKLWDEWETLIHNRLPDEAERFYTENEAAMSEGAIVSWAARPLLALMKIRARDGHDTLILSTRMTRSAVRMRFLPTVLSSGLTIWRTGFTTEPVTPASADSARAVTRPRFWSAALTG